MAKKTRIVGASYENLATEQRIDILSSNIKLLLDKIEKINAEIQFINTKLLKKDGQNTSKRGK